MNRLRLCREPNCWKYFKPSTNQIYCGSAKKKTGCSYKNRLKLNKEWNLAHREVLRRINNAWINKHRELRNAKRRTTEYHQKVKLYKVNKYMAKTSQNNSLNKYGRS